MDVTNDPVDWGYELGRRKPAAYVLAELEDAAKDWTTCPVGEVYFDNGGIPPATMWHYDQRLGELGMEFCDLVHPGMTKGEWVECGLVRNEIRARYAKLNP